MDKTAVAEIMAAAVAMAANEQMLDTCIPIKALPDNHSLHNLEQYQDFRSRYRARFQTSVIGDFVRYVENDETDGDAACFVDPDRVKAVAIFNLGSPAQPGHGDDTATLVLKQTSPYQAMRNILNDRLQQKDFSDWIEDWQDHIVAFDSAGNELETRQAILAVRSVDIEAVRKAKSKVEDFAAEKSAMERIEAKSEHTLPAKIEFRCEPYHGLALKGFMLRVSVLTGGNDPLFTVRMPKEVQYQEEIAEEFRDILTNDLSDVVNTYIGDLSL